MDPVGLVLTNRNSIGEWVLAFRLPVTDNILYLLSWTCVISISTGARWDQLTWSFSITASCRVDRWLQALGWEFGSEFVYRSLASTCHSMSPPTISYWSFFQAEHTSLLITCLCGVGGWVFRSLFLARGVQTNAHVSVHASGYSCLSFYIKRPPLQHPPGHRTWAQWVH